MKSSRKTYVFLCNNATLPASLSADTSTIVLNYDKSYTKPLVRLCLPKFVDQVYHLPDRILDLLELAAYIFAGDRTVYRGAKDAVEYHAWLRSMHFVIMVRDAEFWNQPKVMEKLSKALQFMTGDFKYTFDFVPGHSTPPTSLFDREEFAISPQRPASVVLFSGGLDSLGGVLERLETTAEDLYLISHRSGLPSTKKTQNQLVRALREKYPGRIHHYSFDCGLTNERGKEETQRTRAFLFGSIAFALAHRLNLDSFYAYENGVTSVNLLRRQDLINSRASRTTHPKTHALMADFLAELDSKFLKILNPFWDKTKADIFTLIDHKKGTNLISSAVSCSRTIKRLGTATHCGCCFQCIDRRIAAYAAGLQAVDNAGIYSSDIFLNKIESAETRTTALDYVRQAVDFSNSIEDSFVIDWLNELSEVSPFVGMDEDSAIETTWQLCRRHGEQVVSGISDARRELDDLRIPSVEGSLLRLVSDRRHLNEPSKELAKLIAARLKKAIPIAFHSRLPAREQELNDQINAILADESTNYRREFPVCKFALASVIPDHELPNLDLLIEAKYIRKGTPPSKVSGGIAEDVTKYPDSSYILFVVYDPHRAIRDDDSFRQDIEAKRSRCLVAIVR